MAYIFLEKRGKDKYFLFLHKTHNDSRVASNEYPQDMFLWIYQGPVVQS